MMFTISKEQMEILADFTRVRYLDKLVGQIRGNFSEQTAKLPNDEIRACAEEGLVRSAKYKIEPGRDSTLFIYLMFGLHRNFDTEKSYDWIKRLLESANLQSNEKMDVIYNRLKAARGDKGDKDKGSKAPKATKSAKSAKAART